MDNKETILTQISNTMKDLEENKKVLKTFESDGYNGEVTSYTTADNQVLYSARLISVPGCAAVGDTVPNAIEALKEVQPWYFNNHKERGWPLPPPDTSSEPHEDTRCTSTKEFHGIPRRCRLKHGHEDAHEGSSSAGWVKWENDDDSHATHADDEASKAPRKIRASYSQYSLYGNCPLQYKLKYVDKEPYHDVGIELIFGTAMHETIQDWLKLRYAKSKLADHMDFSDILKQQMVKEFKSMTILTETGPLRPCTIQELQEYYYAGIKILNDLYKHANEFFPVKDTVLVGIEIPLEVPLRENLELIAYLDIVLYNKKEDKTYIIDLKTSKKGWTWQKKDDKKTNQLLLYKKYYAEQYDVPPEKIVPVFFILKRRVIHNPMQPNFNKRITKFVPTHGKISLGRATKSWESFLNEAFTEDGNRNPDGKYNPTPAKYTCLFCPYNNNKELCSASYYLGKTPSDDEE